MMIFLMAACVDITDTSSTTESDDETGTTAVPDPEDTTEGTGLNGSEEVSGTVVTIAGTTIAGATVYIPGVTATAGSASATRTFLQGLVASDGTICEDAPVEDEVLIATCTATDGSFILDTTGFDVNPTQIIIQKGTLRIIVPLSCAENICVIDTSYTTVGASTTVTSWPKIAVVTGDLDRMEDVLAKMADGDSTDDVNGNYGRIDPDSGSFVYGSEYQTNLSIIDGNGSTTSEENSLVYYTWEKYITGLYPLVTNGEPVYDIIFINCGNAYESYIVTYKTALQNYVNAGGRLFVTDLSYDFIEQTFPYAMKFEDDPDIATTPGALNAAQGGNGGEQYEALINSNGMKTWLASVDVNSHDTSTPGNPEVDCNYTASQDTITGALLDSELMPLGGLLTNWTHMVSAHTGYSPTVWLSSGSTSVDGQLNRPLSISMDIGENGGRVVYSSYHTANDCPSTTFWPQERALEFLILESF